MEKKVASGGQGTKNKNLRRNTKNRDKDDKLEQNRNKGAVGIVKSMKAMLQTVMYKERD